MTWFRIDDKLATHPKVLMAGNAALGLWVRAGSWCMAHHTDGFVPADVLPLLGGTKASVDRLLLAGLWEPMPTGWAFHDWDQWQLSAADRARLAENGRKGGNAKAARQKEG